MSEKHFIEVEHGEKVAAVHHKADSNKWVFFCHGFGSNKKGSYETRAEKMRENGWNAVRFDFRGNGESDGEFIDQSLSSKIKDLKSVISYFAPERYALFGSSFGGKVIFHAALDLEPELLIGRAPVTYNKIMHKYKAVVDNKGEFTHHPGATIDHSFFDDFQKHSFDEVADSLNIPTAIFHGRSDTTVHPEHTIRAAENLGNDLMIELLKDEKHSFTDKAESYMINQMIAWLHNNEF